MNKASVAVDKAIALARKGLLWLASDQGLYLFVAFLFVTVFNSQVFLWYSEYINVISSHVMVPWSVVLCVLRLNRVNERELKRADTGLLTLLFAWLVVPFYIRFGATFNNVTSWHSHCVAFFAVYAMTREDTAERRAAMLDRVCALFAVLSLITGAALLYTAWTLKTIGPGQADWTFGIYDGCLFGGYHRNYLGMHAVCCMIMCLVGACRRKSAAGKAVHAIPAVMMLVVIVLTQSRAARYATLLALAVGVYGAVASGSGLKKAVVRHAAGMLCAALVLVGGYAGMSSLTDAALRHYALEAQRLSSEAGQPQANAIDEMSLLDMLLASAKAESAEGEQTEIAVQEARVAIDATLSDRTNLWNNLFNIWREQPKYLFIGQGIGRIGRMIAPGTTHETNGTAAVHNAYLQFIADFGLIGFAMLMAFFAIVFFPALRVFYARGSETYPGGRALCMLVVAVLATSFVESPPLAAMSPMNMMLFYALAILCAEGRALKKA